MGEDHEPPVTGTEGLTKHIKGKGRNGPRRLGSLPQSSSRGGRRRHPGQFRHKEQRAGSNRSTHSNARGIVQVAYSTIATTAVHSRHFQPTIGPGHSSWKRPLCKCWWWPGQPQIRSKPSNNSANQAALHRSQTNTHHGTKSGITSPP